MSGETGDLPWPLSFKLLPDAEEIAREKRTSFRLPSSDTLDLTSGKVSVPTIMFPIFYVIYVFDMSMCNSCFADRAGLSRQGLPL